MTLKLIFPTRPLHTCIAPRLRKRQLHRLVEKLKALHLLYRLLRTLYRIKNNESLTLSLEVCLRNYIDDLAIFGEELSQSFLELVNLYALFEVADIYAMVGGLAGNREGKALGIESTCRSAMTRTLRLVVGHRVELPFLVGVDSKKECCGLKLSLDVDLIVEYVHVISSSILPFTEDCPQYISKISSLPRV